MSNWMKLFKSTAHLLFFSLLATSLAGCISLPGAANSHDVAQASAGDSLDVEGIGEAFSLEVGVEPTPVPTSHPYLNTEYGYEFSYPETWQLDEIDQGIELRKDNVRLILQVWWAVENDPPLRWYGMPAGDLLYRDKQIFQEEVIPVHYLVFQERTKQVLYNEGKVISVGDLQVLIYLDSQESDYESIDLSDRAIADARTILESFRVTGQAAPPAELNGSLCATDNAKSPAGWQQYQNKSYGFYLYYPETLTINETSEHTLEFQQANGLTLRMEFRKIDQEYALPGMVPVGEVELTRFVNYFGDEHPNPIVVERSGGKVTSVSVGNIFGRTTPVQFHAVIAGPTGLDIDLDQADAMLEILNYLCLID